MNISALKKSALYLLILVVISSCSSPVPRSSQRTDPYTMKKDVPDLEPIDLSRIKQVIPVREQRTIAGNKSPYEVNGRKYYVMSSEEGYADTGMASWYGRKFHGHLTSNGEIYDSTSAVRR